MSIANNRQKNILNFILQTWGIDRVNALVAHIATFVVMGIQRLLAIYCAVRWQARCTPTTTCLGVVSDSVGKYNDTPTPGLPVSKFNFTVQSYSVVLQCSVVFVCLWGKNYANNDRFYNTTNMVDPCGCKFSMFFHILLRLRVSQKIHLFTNTM